MLRDHFQQQRKAPPAAAASTGMLVRGSTGRLNASSVQENWTAQTASAELPAPVCTPSPEALAYTAALKTQWHAKTPPSDLAADFTLVPAPTDAFCPGFVLNGIYQIDCQLGKGGMGAVYRAFHMGRQIPVVLKLMLQRRAADDMYFFKFVQECKIAMTIEHPNVVSVLDWGILGDTLSPYLVMEFLPGQSLREVLSALHVLPVNEAASVLAQACLGLKAVHDDDIIHRDLKPENLMVSWEDDGSPDGKLGVKIVDFGIAQLKEGLDFTDGDRVLGTLCYMSPEQIQRKPLDLRSDIYAVGVVLYELITGRVPFKGASIWQTMSMQVLDNHVPPSQVVSLPNAEFVDAIVARCLAKEPDRRYPSASSLAAELFALAESTGP